jgi:hypothetical protein
MLDIRIPTIVVNATSYSLSMVSMTCGPITCVNAHLSLHRGDGYCNIVTTQCHQPTTHSSETIQTESSNHNQINGMVSASGGVG